MSNVHQQHAISTFSTMLSRAIAYRETQEYDSDLFNPRYGICDNIPKCATNGASHDTMQLVKDNIIRRLPSYSGNYHYPVRHPQLKEGVSVSDNAENAYCEFDYKWGGDYGLERVKQLEELLDYVKNKWTDKLTENMTACERVGIVKNVTVLQHKDGGLYTLAIDDGSCDPYFTPLGKNSDHGRSIDLRKLTIVERPEIQKMSVKSFINKIEKHNAKREKIKALIEKMQMEVESLNRDIDLLDYGLTQQHKVQRVVE